MTAPVPSVPDEPSNWGRWGADDELGTLNFITPAARARGVAEAQTGQVVSLAATVAPVPMGAPVPFGLSPMPAGVLQTMNWTGSPAMALTDMLLINSHHGSLTHIDALCHVPTGDQVYPGISIRETVVAGTIRQGSTAAFTPGIVTRGVFLDLAPEGKLDAGAWVTGADLDAAAERGNVRLESGDALVLRGGWTPAASLRRSGAGDDHGRRAVDARSRDQPSTPVTSATGHPFAGPPTEILAMHQLALGQARDARSSTASSSTRSRRPAGSWGAPASCSWSPRWPSPVRPAYPSTPSPSSDPFDQPLRLESQSCAIGGRPRAGLHRLTKIVIGVPNVDETAAYYTDFGPQPAGRRRGQRLWLSPRPPRAGTTPSRPWTAVSSCASSTQTDVASSS